MKRPTLKRRARPSLRAHVRTYWLLAIVAAAITLWAGWALATLPAFRLKSVALQGASHVSQGEILRMAAIDPRANVWLLDREAIQRRIEAIPYVGTARLHRRFPATVVVALTERRPAACVRGLARELVTVDVALRVLARGCASPAPLSFEVRAALDGMPGTYLHDRELLALTRDARALAGAGHRYRLFRHDAYGDLEATMDDGIRIRFGDDGDLERKGRLIGPILAQLGAHLADVRALDVRAPATPVVEYRAQCTACPTPTTSSAPR